MKTYNKRMIITNGIGRVMIPDDTPPKVISLILAQLNAKRNRPMYDGMDSEKREWVFSRWFNRSCRVKRTYH